MGIMIRLKHDRNLGMIFRFLYRPIGRKIIFAVIPGVYVGPCQGSRMEFVSRK